MHRDGSSVMFPLGSWGVSGLATSDPTTYPNDPVGIDLTPTTIPAANLRIDTRKKKMTTEMALYIILQQPIRAKLYWWLLSLSFKNREATLLLLFGHNDVIIRLFVHSGMYFFLFPPPPPPFFLLTEKKNFKIRIKNLYIKIAIKTTNSYIKLTYV